MNGKGLSLFEMLQQLQVNVLAGTNTLGDTYISSVPTPCLCQYHTHLQTLGIKLFIETFTLSSFIVTPIWVKTSSPSYVELVVPDDSRLLSPPNAKYKLKSLVEKLPRLGTWRH